MFHKICSYKNICERQTKKYFECLKDKNKKKEDCNDFFFELYSCINHYDLSKRIQIENNQIHSVFYKHTEPIQKRNR